MRIALANKLVFRQSLAIRIPVLKKSHWPVLFLICLAFQPFGSFAALGAYLAFVTGFVVLNPIRGRNLANWGVSLVYLTGVLALLALVQPINPVLFAFYSVYWTLGVLIYSLLANRIDGSTRAETLVLVNWILAMDLAINLPPCIIELIRDGVGDWVTGLSGLILEQSASQNRTNSVRAVLLAILALVSYREQRNRLSLYSFLFNVGVLILATSMTTIMSAVGALGAVMLLRRFTWATVLLGIFLIVAVIGVDLLNQHFLKTESMFSLITEINTRWLPKVDMYRQYAAEMIFKTPWLLLFGYGIGNFMNRFAILANFTGYGAFPGKEAVSHVMSSQYTKTYLVDYYGLDFETTGSSILVTPWSGLMSLVTEWGLVGLTVMVLCAWPLLKALWMSPYAALRGPGRFLILFMGLNLFFDCYQDYPELMVPLMIIALLMTRIHAKAGEADAMQSNNR